MKKMSKARPRYNYHWVFKTPLVRHIVISHRCLPGSTGPLKEHRLSTRHGSDGTDRGLLCPEGQNPSGENELLLGGIIVGKLGYNWYNSEYFEFEHIEHSSNLSES
jgi:hypothetical protein